MADQHERMIEGYRVVIDRNLCVGFGDCVQEGPQVFELDEENVAIFVDTPRPASSQQLFLACRACPVDALSVWDQNGRQMLP
jgi:ferredoxin